MPEIAILLTTYNGSQFLKEQIDSLVAQTYQHWQLYVRDDQSEDETPRLLTALAETEPRIHILRDPQKRGAKHGFMWLLQQVDAPFYMFCDHDDVWLPDKIELSMKAMQAQPEAATLPFIVCTDAELADAQLHTLSPSYWKHKQYRQDMFNDKYYHLFYNNMPGCTMLINRQAKAVALPWPEDTAMHDSWIAAAVLWRGGRVVWTRQPLILYRQHGHNTIGTSDRTLAEQLRIIPELMAKTRVQHHACRTLTGMSFLRFFLLKLRFLLQYHWAATRCKK